MLDSIIKCEFTISTHFYLFYQDYIIWFGQITPYHRSHNRASCFIIVIIYTTPIYAFRLEHEGNVVVRHTVAKVGGAVLGRLEDAVKAKAVPVEVANVHGGTRAVVGDGPHLC